MKRRRTKRAHRVRAASASRFVHRLRVEHKSLASRAAQCSDLERFGLIVKDKQRGWGRWVLRNPDHTHPRKRDAIGWGRTADGAIDVCFVPGDEVLEPMDSVLSKLMSARNTDDVIRATCRFQKLTKRQARALIEKREGELALADETMPDEGPVIWPRTFHTPAPAALERWLGGGEM